MDLTKGFYNHTLFAHYFGNFLLNRAGRYCWILNTIPFPLPHSDGRRPHRGAKSPTTARMFPCRPLVSPPLPRALVAAAPVSVRRLPWPSSWSPTSLRVVRCMAKERRVRMVAKQIQRELADMLTRDPVMQRAVLPEAALGADRYLSSLTTIADVELSNDLQVDPGRLLETMRLRRNLGRWVAGVMLSSLSVCRCVRCMCPCLGTRGGRRWPWPGSRTRPSTSGARLGSG
ncbi:hypothetical protein VPH35_120718 [Triticum aestivum]